MGALVKKDHKADRTVTKCWSWSQLSLHLSSLSDIFFETYPVCGCADPGRDGAGGDEKGASQQQPGPDLAPAVRRVIHAHGCDLKSSDQHICHFKIHVGARK